MNSPYDVVGAPQNYAAPIVNLFGQQGQQQQKPQQPGQPQPGQPPQGQPQTQQMGQQAGQAFAALLQRFMQQGGGSPQPGAPMQLPSAPQPQVGPGGSGVY